MTIIVQGIITYSIRATLVQVICEWLTDGNVSEACVDTKEFVCDCVPWINLVINLRIWTLKNTILCKTKH